MIFKTGNCWRCCYDPETGRYTAEIGGGHNHSLYEITKEIFDRVDDPNVEWPASLICEGRQLYMAVDDRCGPPYTVVLDSDYQKICPWAKTRVSGRVWSEELTDAAVEVFASEANNRPQRRAKKAAREKQKAAEAAVQKEQESAEPAASGSSAAGPSADGTPRDYSRLTRFLPVLETDETLYDEENGYSDVMFRFLEELELACEKEPEHAGLQEMKRIFDQEESSPGYIFQHLSVLLRGLKSLESGQA
jgi:hypothetical protein